MEDSSNVDLRDFQNSEEVSDAFSALVSGGKPGYKTIIEKSPEAIQCPECTKNLTGEENYCPECGTKLIEESYD
tara:strand:+ start:442 stop:663 length:222 start_codon:yes stop_codon:yes gene_type:complete